MDCLITSEKLSSYIDAELSAAELLEIERHLPGCARCAVRVDRLRAVSGKFAEAPRVDMPADAADRLTAVIDANLAARRAAEPPRTARRFEPQIWLRRLANPGFAGAAAAMAVLALAVIVWSSGALVGDRERRSAPAESLQMPGEAPGSRGILSDEPEKHELGAGGQTLSAPLPTFSAEEIRALVEARRTESYAIQDSAGAADSVDAGGLAAARVAGGDRQVDLLFATLGIYGDREVWVVVVRPVGASGPVTAAAVTPDGELLFRTD